MNRKNKVAESTYEHDVQIIGRHISVTEAMKAYAIEKFNKVDKYNFRVVNAVVTMDIQKLDNRVDIVAHINNTKIKVGASSDDMYASIDKASDRLQSKLRKYTGLLHEHHSKTKPELEINVSIIGRSDANLLEINEDIEAANRQDIVERFRPHEVVSKETQTLKILSQPEAIMKLELSGDNFLIYFAEEDQKLKVIYPRNDGNYGIIEPENINNK